MEDDFIVLWAFIVSSLFASSLPACLLCLVFLLALCQPASANQQQRFAEAALRFHLWFHGLLLRPSLGLLGLRLRAEFWAR